jgi:hypothetical protein
MARKRMNDADLKSKLDQQISDSISYDQSELRERRIRAIDYYEGEVRDIESLPGRSSVVSHDVSDTIGWILPALVRIFLSSDHVVVYEPRRPDSEAGAKQATDYVNYVFQSENDGYKILHAALFDGLLFGNGIIKHWWDDTPEYCTETHSNLTEDAFLALMSRGDIEEAVEHDQRDEMMGMDPQTGEPVTVTFHDVKVKRKTANGSLCVMPLPGEEFLIDRNAIALNEEDCRFVAHRQLKMRSDLIAEGYDREKVKALPRHTSLESDEERQVRERFTWQADNSVDESTEYVEVHECYVKMDYDGDGIAEWRLIVTGGSSGARTILYNEEWGDDLPFSDLVPDPVPHRWRGRSVFDETEDLQRIKTVLMRQTLDNLYHVNNPETEAVADALIDKQSLVDPEFGAVHWVRTPGAIRHLEKPFVAQNSFAMLEYVDQVREQRTGVSRATQALDLDALQNQTATAVNAAQSSAYTKIETYARNIAEIGLKRLFRCILKLIVKHQDMPKTMRLRGDWVQMDPAGWDADMDVTVNVGLGSGSRDRDMAMLTAIAQQQKEILMQLGPVNPLVTLQEFRNTLSKMVEAGGLKSPEQYFKEIDPQEMQQLMQQMQQQQNPDGQKEQAKMQLEAQKAQADMQMKQVQMQAEMQMRQAEVEQRHQTEMEKIAKELALKREQMQIEAQLRREQIEAEMMLKREKMQLEIQHKIALDATHAVQNVQMGGDVG